MWRRQRRALDGYGVTVEAEFHERNSSGRDDLTGLERELGEDHGAQEDRSSRPEVGGHDADDPGTEIEYGRVSRE